MVLFIRHGEKEYANNKNPPNKPAHDPPLKASEYDKIVELTIRLYSQYGAPERLIVSPFERTRETAYIMQYIIAKNYNKFVIVYFDKDIQEFLGHQKPVGNKPDITTHTKLYCKKTLGTESLTECRERIIRFHSSLYPEQNIWVITHGILMNMLFHYLHNENRTFKCLDYFNLTLSDPRESEDKDLP